MISSDVRFHCLCIHRYTYKDVNLLKFNTRGRNGRHVQENNKSIYYQDFTLPSGLNISYKCWISHYIKVQKLQYDKI